MNTDAGSANLFNGTLEPLEERIFWMGHLSIDWCKEGSGIQMQHTADKIKRQVFLNNLLTD